MADLVELPYAFLTDSTGFQSRRLVTAMCHEQPDAFVVAIAFSMLTNGVEVSGGGQLLFRLPPKRRAQ